MLKHHSLFRSINSLSRILSLRITKITDCIYSYLMKVNYHFNRDIKCPFDEIINVNCMYSGDILFELSPLSAL